MQTKSFGNLKLKFRQQVGGKNLEMSRNFFSYFGKCPKLSSKKTKKNSTQPFVMLHENTQLFEKLKTNKHSEPVLLNCSR